MKFQKWNEGWKYWIAGNAFALIWNIPNEAEEVTLPHDAMMKEPARADSKNGGNTGYRDGNVYHYVKLFTAPGEYRDKTVMLKFEGIYMNAMVYVNGELAGKCPYGYTGFFVKLNDFLHYEKENEVRIIVKNNAMTNSRWYSGGGIYRDVWLLVSDMVYFVPEGVQVTTETLDEELAALCVTSELRSRRCRGTDLRLETVLLDEKGEKAACDTVPVQLFEQEERRMARRLFVSNPKSWSAETPVCYTCVSRLWEGEKLLDENRTEFGIRKVSVDAVRGFRVNGKEVKLRGACIHHDSGLLGAATWYDAEYRRVRLLKEAGFNAIRMSHHPAAPVLLEACDTLGMYVMDETFDMWNRCKSDSDYGLYFSEWWERDTEAMVRKDYNHPSVILYSVGNEIPEIGTKQGAQVCHDICEKIKALDSTRYTLASINGVFAAGGSLHKIMGDLTSKLQASGEPDGNVNDFMTLMDNHMDQIVVHEEISKCLERACANTDIAGYNYMTARYEGDGKSYPNRIIAGSETYPPEIARNWELVKKLPHVIGDFAWTGWDYIGEAGVGVPAYRFGEGGFNAQFPCQLAYSGDIDITGFRRPASYFREIVFGLRKEPYIAVQNPFEYGRKLIKTPWVLSDAISSWTYSGCEGKPVIVEIYAPGEEVELFLNDRSLGMKAAGAAAGFRAFFETVYEPGSIRAVSYKEGKVLGSMELKTAGEGTLVLNAEPEGDDLVYITVVHQDIAGNVITDRELKLHANVSGTCTIAGFGNGNPKPRDPYDGNDSETFQGRALLILKRGGLQGMAEVEITGEGKRAELKINY